MTFFCVFMFGALLFLDAAVEAGKCPKMCTCDGAKLTVACVGKNLTEVPSTVDEITLKLDLRGNHLQVLPRGAFLHTPYLTHLDLQRCGLVHVKEGAFRTLGRVVSLNLAYNNIDILYQEAFDGLSSLKELLLDHNRVEEVQPGAFMQLGFLNLLQLSHNQLVYLPNMAFQGLQNIQWLRLSHNSINNLAPEAFAGLLSLGRLSLDHNELQLPALTRLDMGSNPMTYLGEEAVALPWLTSLLLDHMSLQDLSDTALTRAPRLTHLDLSHNQLRCPEPPRGPTALLSLNLTGNPILCNCFLRPLRQWALQKRVNLLGACAGPAHLAGGPLGELGLQDLRCRSRQEIRVGAVTTATPVQWAPCPGGCDCQEEAQHASCEGRGHTTVPRGFPNNTQLLDLRGNPLGRLPSDSFPGASRVVSLHLELCQLHRVEGGAFGGMTDLFYLYLSHNGLTVLGPGAFSGAPGLTYLHLEGNRLAAFPGAALKPLPSLLALHLEGNAISALAPGGLLGAPALRELYLTNNTVATIAPGALDSAHLDALHLDSNRLTAVPSRALRGAPALRLLQLSGNPIRTLGARAFQPAGRSLRRLYLDGTGLQTMSREALVGLGAGLVLLSLGGNQLEGLPDLRALEGLEEVNLLHNPLRCDCPLLPLRRWVPPPGDTAGAMTAGGSALR
uniref:Chondroadherin-like protein n=1 Tax=Gadus morhua TaxID=8049 RepID=A0A8C4YYZ5_GADMO